jgi:hypothetical protein
VVLLAPEALDLGQRHAHHVQVSQGLLRLVELERFDDGLIFFMAGFSVLPLLRPFG